MIAQGRGEVKRRGRGRPINSPLAYFRGGFLAAERAFEFLEIQAVFHVEGADDAIEMVVLATQSEGATSCVRGVPLGAHEPRNVDPRGFRGAARGSGEAEQSGKVPGA